MLREETKCEEDILKVFWECGTHQEIMKHHHPDLNRKKSHSVVVVVVSKCEMTEWLWEPPQ